MRRLRLAGLLVLTACAGTIPPAGGGSGDDGGGVPQAGTHTLGADLFPCEARTSTFRRAQGSEGTLRVEPSADGAVLWFAGADGAPKRMDVRRVRDGLMFSGGPDAETELIRLGASPGAEWTSGPARVTFEGWERVTVPAGTYDAARVRVTTGPAALAIVETWWFAPGTGLVRLRSDRGGVFADEMSLAR